MGTKLPLYGYIDPTATGLPWGKKRRAENVDLVPRFLAYMSRSDVQQHGRSMILDGFDLGVDPWARGVHHETNSATRPELKQLIDQIGSNGTIVVPTVGDLCENKTKKVVDLVERILVQKITVLAMRDEEFPLDQYTRELHVGTAVYEAMSNNVLRARSTLERFVQNRKKMPFALTRQPPRPGRPHSAAP